MVATCGLNQQIIRVNYFTKIYLFVIYPNLVTNLKLIMSRKRISSHINLELTISRKKNHYTNLKLTITLWLINSHTTKDIIYNLQCPRSIMAETCVQYQTEKLVFIQKQISHWYYKHSSNALYSSIKLFLFNINFNDD
jgi:hypothetical protein